MGIGDMCAMGNRCGMSNRCGSICSMGNMSNWCCNMCGMSNRCGSICMDNIMYGIRLRYFDGVGFGNMFFDDHFAFHGDGDGHWDFDLVFVNYKLGFDAGDLWGHDGVGADGGLDFG